MSYIDTKEYEKWINSSALSPDDKRELEAIEGDEKEIRERFSTLLSFGTAGLRGIMRMGLNGMNTYTVRLAAQAMALTIIKREDTRSVTIAFDSRNNSEDFAWEAASVLAANGVPVNIFESLRPTPELSFALRETGSVAGINITASHNTKEYNGFKVYWEDGAQIGVDLASEIAGTMESLDIFNEVRTMSGQEALERGLVTILGEEMDEAYISKVMEQSVGREYASSAGEEVKIVYTPFHGTGYRLVPRVLERIGMKKIYPVEEQMVIDGDFPTVASPNPEYREGFDLSVAFAEEVGADIIIGTDPDGDRCGVTLRYGDEYRTLTGNQTGALLLDYIIRARKDQGSLRDDHVVIKSIVSTTMADAICRYHGVEIENVLTGFKYIGEKIKEFERTGEHSFLFGFEESNGYLAGTYARDKDAILASMLISEMACYHHTQGRSLVEAMENLYETYGHYREKVVSFVFEGLDGKNKMAEIMEQLRNHPPKDLGLAVVRTRDYRTGEIKDEEGRITGKTGLPESNILFYELDRECTAIIRPSGTEPKIKFYIMARGGDAQEVEDRLNTIERAGSALLDR